MVARPAVEGMLPTKLARDLVHTGVLNGTVWVKQPSPENAELRIGVERSFDCLQPRLEEDDIVIAQQNVAPACLPHAVIDRRAEAQVLVIAKKRKFQLVRRPL